MLRSCKNNQFSYSLCTIHRKKFQADRRLNIKLTHRSHKRKIELPFCQASRREGGLSKLRDESSKKKPIRLIHGDKTFAQPLSKNKYPNPTQINWKMVEEGKVFLANLRNISLMPLL